MREVEVHPGNRSEGGTMTPQVTCNPKIAKNVLLAAAATVTIVAPMAIASFFVAPARAIAQAPESNAAAFQSATVQETSGGFGIGLRPGQFIAKGFSLRQL